LASEFKEKLERTYASGELDSLKHNLLPYLRAQRDCLAAFIKEFQEKEKTCSLAQMVKIFILQQNMPFNMRDYMTRQSHVIHRDTGECSCPEERQKAVADWIKHRAADHRSASMFEQVFCFEKLKAEILPILEEELADVLIPESV
jgi:hypothetical protein